jgi:hypothetical protein
VRDASEEKLADGLIDAEVEGVPELDEYED